MPKSAKTKRRATKSNRSTSGKRAGGGTSRHKARGGSQRGTKRKGMGASGGGSGRRSTSSVRKRATRTGPKQSSVHAPKNPE